MKTHAPASSRAFASLRKSARLKVVIVALLTPGLSLWTLPIQGNPSGGIVVHGDVSFGGSAGNLQITQNSQNAIINWADFSINAGELTQFNQPGVSAAVLNRVTGGNPTAIHGALQANGNVFVINPNGILVGAGGTIDVHGLALSTLDVSNGEFLAGGDMVFQGQGAGVTNMGRINAIGGDVFLIGQTVTNMGSIKAGGTVGLAAGTEVLLSSQGNSMGERVFVRAGGAGGTGVLNDGSIEGAAVELKAHGNMYALAINNKGSVRATGATNSGGRVFLKGVGGSVSNTGSIRAASPSVGSGGRVLIEAAYARVDGMIRAERGSIKVATTDSVDIGGSLDASSATVEGGLIEIESSNISLSASSDIDVSGFSGGGVAKIGGGFQGRDDTISNADNLTVAAGSSIRANALDSGDGGVVILWSDDTTVFEGSVSARGAGAVGNGGFAEISGKGSLGFDGVVDLTSDHGLSGSLLLDPTNVTISNGAASASNINNVALSNTLDLGNNVIITTNFGGAEDGDITVNNRVEWYAESAATTPGTLTLLANRHVIFRDSVRSAGEGGLNIVAGWDGTTGIVTPLSGAAETTPGAFNMAAVLATMNDGNAANDAAGNNDGSVIVGATNTTFDGRVNLSNQVIVGSRFGDTSVAAHDLYIWGANNGNERFAHLGFRDTGYEIGDGVNTVGFANNGLFNEWYGSDGAVDGSGGATVTGNVQNKDYIALLGGTRFNGGAFDGAGSGASGDINIGLSGRLDMRTGDDNDSYTQIGHGGSNRESLERQRNNGGILSLTTRDGYVMDSGDNNRQFFSATWRNNIEANPFNGLDAGNTRSYSIDGDINIHVDEDVLVLAAWDLEQDAARAALNAANQDGNSGNSAQIGHGGIENHGSFHGNISVTAEGAVSAADGSIARPEGIAIDVIGGRSTFRHAMIGHGSTGEGNRRTIFDQTRSGNIDVEAVTGAIRLQGYNEPNGLSTSAWQYSHVQIGHGGSYAQAPTSGGTFTLPDNTAVTGTPDNSATGNITVSAAGTYLDSRYDRATDVGTKLGISVQASNNHFSYGQIGHGGSNQRANTNTGYQGDISVTADQGDVLFAGGADRVAERSWGYGRNHVQVGHGGYDTDGAKGGLVSVSAGQGAGATDGDILFYAGKHRDSFAQIGHGGSESGGDYNSAQNAADITVNAYGDILFESGESGTVDALNATQRFADLYFNDSALNRNRDAGYYIDDRFVMIGHGGKNADGVQSASQNITVVAGTGDLQNADGDVLTGGITFIAGDGEVNFAQIGHGGHGNGGNNTSGFNGDIVVTANGGGVVFDGSIEGKETYVRSNDNRSLDGVANASRAVQVRERGWESYVQIGNGGYASRGNHSGDITITSYGNVDMIGAVNNSTSAQAFTAAGGDDLSALTGGVQMANSSNNLWISVSPLTDTAAATANAIKVSQGPVNVKPGTLRIVLSDGTIITDLPDADNDERESNIVDQLGNDIGDINYEQGLVRFNTPTIGSGSASVESIDYVSISGHKERAYVQIGNGGYETDGVNNNRTDGGHTGDISIVAASDIRLHGSAYHRGYAQLGHGGYDTKGAHSGDITIDIAPGTTGGKLEVLAGVGGHRHYDYQAYGQLGHGGYAANGNHFGDITITNGRNATDGIGVLFKSGTTQDSYTQLGHGGRSSRSGENLDGSGTGAFGLNGDIVIQTEGDVAFVAGTATRNNDAWTDDFRLYTQLGHGGWDADPEQSNDNNFGVTNGLFSRTSIGDTNAGTAGAGDGNWGHFGDIVVETTAGNISFMAGSNVALNQRLDSEGNVLDLPADPNGMLVSHGDGIGRFHSAFLGHGGIATSGDHHGSIRVTTQDGSVSVVGGDRTLDNDNRITSFASIGHNYSYQDGGPNGHLGRSDESIVVHALGANGNVNVIAGNGEQNFAMIGLGGNEADGTHTSDVQVYAGNNINLQGGIAKARELTRNGEFQDMAGANGGNNNDLSEFNAFYGTGNLNLLLMDEAAAAGGGQKTRLMNRNITAGSVEFRIDDAGHTYTVGNAPDIIDDGAGNLVAQVNLTNGSATAGAVVGTIDYVTGEITWNTAVIDNASDNPDMFVDYRTTGFHRNDAIQSFAQIGHGGNNSTPLTNAHPEGGSVLGHSGDIDVRAGVDAAGAFTGTSGTITALAGNDRRNYVQIGHGGTDTIAAAGGVFEGNIDVRADGGLRFRGGIGLEDDFNVAWNYDAGAGNNNTRAAGVTGGTTNAGINDIDFNFAMIGHGGHNSDANNSLDNNTNDPLATDDGHNGDINVLANTGDIDFQAGGGRGYGHFAQIGHGGMNSNGNHFGDIDVTATQGDINFTAGGTVFDANNTDHRHYAMIGHGGHGMTGNLGRAGEAITVAATAGAINFSSLPQDATGSIVPYAAHVYVLNRQGNQDENHRNRARGDENFSLLGHGGSFVYGDKTADINVTAGNGISFSGGNLGAARENGESDNAGSMNFSQIGHGGYFSYRQYRSNISNANLIAGGSNAFDRADDFNVPGVWNGTNWVFEGVGFPMWPTDNSIDAATGQGQPLWDGFSGNIAVTATGGDINFTAGNAHNTFAHIGHGGYETSGDHSGDITVDAQAGSINFNADVDLHGTNAGFDASGNNTFAMIGHGGFYSDGEIGNAGGLTTNIMVNAGNDIVFDGGDSNSFAKIGHGGWADGGTRTDRWGGGTRAAFRRSNDRGYRPGTRTGNIDVDSGGDILFTAGNNDGDLGFVQIGHGGRQTAANPDSVYGDGHSGDVDVNSDGEIVFEGGSRRGDFAMIGHGGYEVFGNHGGDGTDGTGRLDSDITVVGADGITFLATGITNTDTARNFVQIGHGGYRSSFRDVQDVDGANYAILGPYDVGGTIANNGGRNPWEPYTTNPDGLALDLSTGMALNGDLSFATPSGTITAGKATLGTFKGDISVSTTNAGADITFHAPNETDGTIYGNGGESHAMIGHGGHRVFGDIEGDITVSSAGGVDFAAVQGNGTRNSNHNGAFAMVGHGGYESGGDYSGDIALTSVNSVVFQGGDSVDGANIGFVQLGHGGFNSDDDHDQYRDAAKDAAGVRPATSGGTAASPSDTGNSGNITVTVTQGDLEFLAGKDSDAYAQLGHGGRSTRDTHNGNINVDVQTGGIRFIAGTDHGTGDTNPGGNERAYVQLGHGGNDSDGSHFGNINVSAGTFAAGPEAGRGIVFRGGDHNQTSAQIGHGGHGSRTYGQVATGGEGLEGTIDVSSDGEIRFVAGTFFKNGNPFDVGNEAQNYVQIGHGGYNVDAYFDADRQLASGIVEGHSGDISVTTTTGGITFLAAQSGFDTHAGDGGGTYHYAQIGHGGGQAQGDHHGNIEVRAGIKADGTDAVATGDILFAAGGGTTDDWGDNNNYAQIGHGGRMDGNAASSSGNMGLATETISVMAGNDITLTSAGGYRNYVQIGNGGYQAKGDHAGNIQVYAERNFLSEGAQMLADGSTGSNTVSYSFQRASGDGNRTRNLDRAGEFLATSDNNRAAGEADFNFNRALPGTMEVQVRDDSGTVLMTLVSNGTDLVVQADATLDNVDANGDGTSGTETFTAGTVVGSYTAGRIQFNRDVNPGSNAFGGTRNIGVTYQSASSDRSYAMVGHGGYDADLGNNTTVGSTGNISVVARTGDIIARAGNDDENSSMIGHGGTANHGANTGDIYVRAGGKVDVLAGVENSGREFAQIGHGGYDSRGDHSGKVKVSAGTGDLFTNLGTGMFDDSFDFDLDGTRDVIQFASTGDQTVRVLGGGADDTARNGGDDGHAMIGHGGRSSGRNGGTIDGVVAVSATGDITVEGGGNDRAFAQIGNGGWNQDNNVNISGDISVISENGDLLVKAGTVRPESYALIGHGDDQDNNTANSGGTRQGAINVVAGDITLDRSGAEVAWIGHTFDMAVNSNDPFNNTNNNLVNAGDNLGGGYSVIARNGLNLLNNGAILSNNQFTINDSIRDRLITPNLAGGTVTISGGNIAVNSLIDSTTSWNTVASQAGGLNLIASGDIDVNFSIQNPGAGAVNLIAGAQIDAGAIVDGTDLTGPINHLYCPPTGFMEMLGIKDDGTQFGLDNGYSISSGEFAAGNGEVSINANTRGIAVGSAGGATNVLGHRVVLQGGNTASAGEFAQVGYRDLDGTVTATGDIMIEAKEGGVRISGGTQNETYAQVGHGGDDLLNAGGDSAARGLSGMISVRADRGATVGNVEILSAGGNRSSQIGHGGNNNEGTLAGDVVVVGNDITMTAGNSNSMSRIGHGGVHSAAGAKGDISGNIYVNYDPDPDHDPLTNDAAVAGGGGAIVMSSGVGANGSAQIGHGGRLHGGAKSGEIRIENAASVSMTGGNGDRNYIQIGHGGSGSSGAISNANISVDITGANGTDSLSILGGDRQESYAMIGHGGDSADGSVSSSNINVVVADGNVNMAANANAVNGGNRTHSQIGHGGFNDGAAGDFEGNILVDVQSGSLTMAAGEISNSAYTMIGHGGSNNDALTGHSGTIAVNTADDLTITAGLTTAAGTTRFAMIGHGGANSGGSHNGAITLDVGTDGSGSLLATAGDADGAFVQVGHGGQGTPGDKSGALQVDVRGATSFLAGTANDTYAMLGHGGRGSRGDHSGDITLNSVDTITMTGGNDMRSFAQLGHGGHDADTTGTALGNSGEIMINVDPALVQTAGADILLTAGNGEESYVQVGHGGYATQGDHSSTEIHMTTDGDLVLRSGNGTGLGDDSGSENLGEGQRAYAQIGHGGYNAPGNNSTEICIHVGGTITMDSATGGSANTSGFTMIGNGGRNVVGNHSGEVTVVSGTKTAGGLTMEAGDALRQFVQIGHGGDGSSGNMSGAMFVVVDDGTGGGAGDLRMNGGGGGGSYVMIGQGDGRGTYGNFGSGNTSGTRTGGIQYFVNNNAILNTGSAASTNAHLLHRTNSNGGLDFPTNYGGGTGYQYVVNGTTTGTAGNLARENESEIVAGNVGGGNVVITNTGDLTLDIPTDPTLQYKNDAFNFIVLATGNLTFNRSIQNAGTGNVALVAGWDGNQDTSSVTYTDPLGNINFCEPEIIPGAIDFNDCDAFGLTAATGDNTIHTGGILTVGTAGQTTATRVGSLFGETILRGNQIDIVSGTAANTATQIGFYGTGVDGVTGETGKIDIMAKTGGLNLISGAGAGSYTQIGHGGAGGGAGAGATGVGTAPTNPTGIINGVIDISFCEPGAVTATGGGNGAYAQIGHGIDGQDGERNGNISITNFTDLSLNGGATGDGAFAQIGHGGVNGLGDKSGTITLTGTTTAASQGNLSLTGGGGANAYSQIGHGGVGVTSGAVDATAGASDITITNVVNTTLQGGLAATGLGAYSQIGSGGLNHADSIAGNVSLTSSGAITMTGGGAEDAYTQIGVGGANAVGTKTSTTTVNGGSLSLMGGTAQSAYAQVGAGGDLATGTITGAIDIDTTAGAVTVASGSGTDAYAQIGAGGHGTEGVNSTITSNITIDTVGGGLVVDASAGGDNAYAQVGSGGLDQDGNKGGDNDIVINSGGNVELKSGDNINAYSQIGVGGAASDGTKNGGVTLNAGTNTFAMTSGDGENAFSQIGTGGDRVDGNSGDITDGTTTVTANGGTTMTSKAGEDAYVQIGAGGNRYNTGAPGIVANTILNSNMGVTMDASGGGNDAYVMIGIGGADVNEVLNGNVTVNSAGGAITMTGGGAGDTFTQIGVGGDNADGAKTSVTTVIGQSIAMTGGSGGDAYSQIGAGGNEASGDITGKTDVDTTGGGIVMTGGSGTDSYAQIGAGGLNADTVTATGHVSVTEVNTVGGGLTMDALTNGGDDAYVMIGLGGRDTDGALSGDITATIDGNVVMTSGAGNGASTQIGVGGADADGEKDGSVTVNAGANTLTMAGGSGTDTFSQIGSGGDSNDASTGTTAGGGAITDGAVTVTANGGTTMTSGSGGDSYVQIGAGGNEYGLQVAGAADITGAVIVNTDGGLTMNSSGGGADAYTHIGAGGLDADGVLIGNVTVNANNGAVTMTGGGADGYAQIGVGGDQSDGAKTSVTTVSGQSIAMTAGAGDDAYVQIGAGGNESDGDITGKTDVDTTAGGISMIGGAGADAFARIGAGGLNSDTVTAAGHVSATEVNTVGGGLTMDALTNGGDDGFVQIGLGGRDVDGKLTGDVTVVVDGNVAMSSGAGDGASSQIGIGGADADGEKDGAVVVNAGANTLTMASGTGLDSFSQIGAGGDNAGGAILDGAVTVTANGGTTMTANAGDDAYVQIGSGGNEYGKDVAADSAITGDIILNSNGGLAMNGVNGGIDGYVHVGSGGIDVDGVIVSSTTVNAGGGAITMQSGGQDDAYSQIGAGGENADDAKTGVTTVVGQSIAMTAGTGADAYTQIGAGGNESQGDITGKTDVDTTGGGITMTSGAGIDAYAQIGAGGLNADTTTATGHVSVTEVNTVGGGLVMDAMTSGGDDSYVQIGLGGRDADGALSGDITAVIDGNVVMTSGSGNGASTQIGVGGADADGVKDGAVILNAGANTLTMTGGSAGAFGAGTGFDSFAQIGTGGDIASGNITDGAVTVTANGGTTMTSGDGDDAFVQIGAGGNEYGNDATDSNITGAVVLNSNLGVTLNSAAGGVDSYTQVGSGGINVDGTTASTTTVNSAAGAVSLTGGAGRDSYSQIGAGGSGGDGALTGANTSVTATTVSLNSGAGRSAYTLIGAGGGSSSVPEAFDGTVAANTTVTASGAVSLNAGGGQDTFSQIGIASNGGTGTVDVTTQSTLSITGGSGTGASAQIGHGVQDGTGTGNSGAVTVTAVGNLSVASGTGEKAFAQIGHGTEGVSLSHTGDICVHTDAAAVINATGATAVDSYAMIGHGGVGVAANQSGFVTLTADGNVTVQGGGSAANTFAHIGHGGATDANGDFSGSVSVVSGGNVNVIGGALADSGAMIGHGSADGVATGNRTGGLNVFANGTITQTDGAAGSALISHQSGDGVGSLDYSGSAGGDAGFSLVGLSGLSIGANQTSGAGSILSLSETIAAGIVGGDVTIASGGAGSNLTIGTGNGPATVFSSANTLTIAAGGDLTILDGIQNQGTGAINAIAGWANTGSTAIATPTMSAGSGLGSICIPDFQPITIASPVLCTEFGVNNGTLYVGNGNQTAGVNVGSRGGTVNALGYGVILNGSNTTANGRAQIGYYSDGAGPITGDINVQAALGGLELNSGSQAGAFTQIGHGGFGSNSTTASGNIDISFCEPTDLTLTAGAGNDAYAQIGHGGNSYAGNLSGSINVSPNVQTLSVLGGGGTNAAAQIGMGGVSSSGTKDAAIALVAEEVTIRGGGGTSSGAQIGNGGRGGIGAITGPVSVTSTVGDIVATAGTGGFSGATIGQGGTGYNGSATGQDVTVTSAGEVSLVGGQGNFSAAMIGNGGTQSQGSEFTGNVTVTAASNVNVISGTGLSSAAQIGNGGASADAGFEGDVTVTAGNDVTVTANDIANGSYAQIGNGDDYRGGLSVLGSTGTRSGAVQVAAGSDVTVTDGLIGHTNSETVAGPVTGVTQIAVSTTDTTDPAGGNLVMNSGSQISGADEIRVYAPRRANNQIAAGALLNGVTWSGAPLDPAPAQRIDEFTINIIAENGLSVVNQHDSTFGSGPAPLTAGGFAFYYDTILLEQILVIAPPEGSGPRLETFFPTDRTQDEWQREANQLYTGFNSFGIYFEGYDHYGPQGESLFDFINGNSIDTQNGAGNNEEDVLRRQQRILEEEAEQEEDSE